MDINDINDIREAKDFNGVSFSNFKKTDVKKELLKSLLSSKIEPACYWSAELVCAGHFLDIWETIIFFFCKYIHLGNIKIAAYLEMKIEVFRGLMNVGYKSNHILVRNNSRLRKLIVEVICILCHSKQKPGIEFMKIDPNELDISVISERLNAPNTTYAEGIFMSKDPKELYIAINEMSYSINSKDVVNSCYWLEWLIEVIYKNKSNKTPIRCERRSNIKVDSKLQMDVVWMIWDIFLKESKNKSQYIQKTVRSLLSLFILQYKASYLKKRKNVLYCVISVLCENSNLDAPLLRDEDKNKTVSIMNNVDIIYQQIKKNEISPATDYLFRDVKKSNLNKTIEKLEKMDSFSETFIPRL